MSIIEAPVEMEAATIKPLTAEPALSEGQQLLKKALALMEDGHWCKWVLWTEDGQQFCALGALHMAETGDKDAFLPQSQARTEAFQRLVSLTPTNDPIFEIQTRIAIYNNSRQDFSEIRRWFEDAIRQ